MSAGNEAPRWAFTGAPAPADPEPAATTAGICANCRQWTHGQYLGHVETASGSGPAFVTHDVGNCPGPRRRP